MRWGMTPLRAVLLVAICGLLLPAATAWAEPPSNDDFANREVLSGALPIEVTRSNVEATKEEGEFIPGLAPAGHSIWFEWEAESTGWVTIGACDDEFPTILAVFTGTELEHLTPAAGGNKDEGPDCPYSQRQFTFKATSGTKYVIAVDGNIFHLPEAPTPVTEGEIVLRIEETPAPPNDDFADATIVSAPVEEEPGGNRFSFAAANGFNWTATEEAEEPPAAAGAAGLSVWYRWTAPGTGNAHFSICCATGHLLGIYRGSAPGALEVLFLGSGFSHEMQVTEGETLYLGVDSQIEESTGEPDPGFFQLQISMQLPPLPPTPPPVSSAPQPDLTAPQTTLSRSAIFAASRSAKFWFSSSEPGGFLCRLDKHPYRACGSPKRYKHLKPGRHVFRVYAVDAAGNPDPSPAVARFKLPHPKRIHG